MTGQILGGGVNHHIRTQRKRLLQVRGHERVVHNRKRPETVGHRGDGAYVVHLEQWIGQGFKVDGLGRRDAVRAVAFDGGLQCCNVLSVDGLDDDSPASEELIELGIRSAINIVTDHDAVTGLENAQYRMNRRQPRGERKTTRSLLELSDLLFQEVACGIAAACIVITGHRVDPLESICRRVVDRRVHGSGVVVSNRQSVDELSVEPGHCAPPLLSRYLREATPRAAWL